MIHFVALFKLALLLGDIEERIRVLTSMGQLPLAALTARLYKLDDISAALEEALGVIIIFILFSLLNKMLSCSVFIWILQFHRMQPRFFQFNALYVPVKT
jgi:uncharacterized membrane protein